MRAVAHRQRAVRATYYRPTCRLRRAGIGPRARV